MFAQLSLPSWLGGPTTPAAQCEVIISTLFPHSFLSETLPDPLDTTQNMTQKDLLRRQMLHRFSVTRLQTPAGRLGQLAAALSHHITQDQCVEISSKIGKVVIVTGTDDNLVNPENSYTLHEWIEVRWNQSAKREKLIRVDSLGK